jgi:hypothetical protein
MPTIPHRYRYAAVPHIMVDGAADARGTELLSGARRRTLR